MKRAEFEGRFSRYSGESYHDLALQMSVPHTDDVGVPADHQSTTVLLPVSDYPHPAPHLNYLVQATECADHLYRAIRQVRVVVPIQTNHPVCYKKAVSGVRIAALRIDKPAPVRMIPPTS